MNRTHKQLYERMVREHTVHVRRYLGGWGFTETEVEDLTQETFLQAWKTLPSYREESSPKVWLLSICRRVAWRFTQQNPRTYEIVTDEMSESPQSQIDNQKLLEERSRLKVIAQNMVKLSPLHQEVLILHYMQDLTEPELSSILGVPPGTVHSRLRAARQQLRTLCQR